MTYYDKKNILNDIFENIEMIDEKDRVAILAYIQGTVDTRERVAIEKNKKEKN